MKVTVLQEDFAKALAFAVRFTTPKVQLPILSNVLLSAEKNVLRLSATNLEISICLSIGAEVIEEGKITLPARTITDIIGNLPKGKISLISQDSNLNISSKGFSSKIAGMEVSEFPTIPDSLSKNVFKLPVKELSDALAVVLPAVSIDESRPILTGVLFILRDKELVLVATDGFRLSQKRLKVETKEDSRIIVPKGILQEIMRVKDEGSFIEISYTKTENQLVVKMENAIMSSRLIDGDFPDYEKIVPKEINISIILEKESLFRAIKIASVFAKDSANVVKLKITLPIDGEGGRVDVFAESAQKGNQSTELEADITAKNKPNEDLTMVFNCKFLEDFLTFATGTDIEIDCTDSASPAIFKDLSNPELLHIIMPIKMQ